MMISNDFNILANKTIAVDLTPVLSGGENGGAKILAINLVKEMANLMPECNFVLLTLDTNTDELSQIAGQNIKLINVNTLVNSRNSEKTSGIFKRICRKILRISRRVFSRMTHFFLGHRFAARIKQTLKRSYNQLLRKMQKNPFDLLFCPFTNPVYHKQTAPTVCVVLDIQFHFYPQFFADEDEAHRRHVFTETCKKANQIITISDYVKQTVLDHAPYDVKEKIETIHIGLTNALHRFSHITQDKLLKKFLIQKENYLLYPANYWKHKNHEMLLTAFAIFINQFSDSDLKLVCTGSPSERMDYLKSMTIKMGLQDKVIFTGFLSEEEFSAVFDGCKAVIYPSLFEGFGMPVLEALANSKPLLCSNVTSIPEIAGENGAVYFDPRKPMEIVAAIKTLEFEPDNIKQNQEYGLRRAAEIGNLAFMAKKYLSVFVRNIQNFNY